VAAGARVIAIELHPSRATELRRRFSGRDVRVVEADAGDLWIPRRPFRVVANPPFAATTGLVRRLVARGSRLQSADLIVPWHAARRWTGPSAPAVARWGRELDAVEGPSVPRSAFSPPAPNGAAVLILRRRHPSSPRRSRRR